ncbi:fructan beta-fructosidase [Catalinimonas alkaloidigena]|uniref:Fructan beta-fructosidase n=1 Tax=Catalinimonas alkaloidigena TaxID=1075417 RepID=A0A1G8WZ92_9BACT|nr:glycoside hydrolase family 32 protein [Catalinimonas alkaloidigena]SDJ83593.1 fructan beta-fructosidase [Catalinimonas alkaloidigena]
MSKLSSFVCASVGLCVLMAGCQTSSQENATATAGPSTASGQDTLEQHRPLYHFTPPEQWMNDPNGMVFYDGEYHLFYQHYPDSNVWGPMHWGHAVSRNLVTWEHLPIALYPDSIGMIFSGSSVADVDNTSGFGSADNPPLVAMFTYHNAEGERARRNDYQTQGIAYSLDKGRTWEKYANNPVVNNPGLRDFRDPNLFWHEPTQRWVLILAAGDRVRLYNSPDLKAWTFLSEFGEKNGDHGGVWECPDLFPMMVNGQQKWVMLLSINPGGPNGGSATQYFVGNFDGKKFTTDYPNDTLWIDYGPDDYAGVTWSNVPESDGRRLFIGWMSNWDYAKEVPTYAWRSAMTVARTLSLVQTDAGVRLASRPVQELEQLRNGSYTLSAATVRDSLDLSHQANLQSPAMEFKLSFDLPKTTASDFGVRLFNDLGEEVRIGYEPQAKQWYIDRSRSGKTDFKEGFVRRITAPRLAESDTLTMHLYVDVASVELFADDGTTVMTSIFFPNEDFTHAALFTERDSLHFNGGEAFSLTQKPL